MDLVGGEVGGKVGVFCLFCPNVFPISVLSLNLATVLPLALALREPQYGCLLLKSPITKVREEDGVSTFSWFFILNCSEGEIFVDMRSIFVFELMEIPVASNSSFSVFGEWEMCTRRLPLRMYSC